MRHSQLLGKLGGGPHGKLAIKAYMAKHSTVFQGDFNKQMIERRRAQKQQALTLAEGTPSDDDSPSSGIHSTGTGADLRFAEDSSNESDDDSDGGCGDYCYL